MINHAKCRGVLAFWMPSTLVLVILAIIYQISYSVYPAVPGNDQQWPLGWWGWTDQGLYLKSSSAFAGGDLSPDEHFYMPLYPLIGSLLIGVTPQHSYWLPDLVLMLGYAIFFLALVSRYIGVWFAALAIIVGMVVYEPLRLQWLIPWTSTLSAFLMMVALFLLDRYLRSRRQSAWSTRSAAFNALLFGMALGALAATRVVDLAIMAPVGLAYAFFVVRDFWAWPNDRKRKALVSVVFGLIGFLPFVFGWLAFNQAVYGKFLGGPYFSAADDFGFFPSTLGTKFYSQIVDSLSLYGEANQDWSARIPIFAVAIAFLPALLFVPVAPIFKIFAVSAILQFGIYYSYSDIVPSGTFRFNNIHYFKWLMPLLLVGMALVVKSALSQPGIRLWSVRSALILTVGIFFAAFGMKLGHQSVSVKVIEQSDSRAVFALSGKRLDFIDIRATTDNWTGIYFAEGFSVFLDGKELKMPREYHPYPIPGGMRLSFVRPVFGSHLIVDLGSEVRFTEPLEGYVEGRAVSFYLGFRSEARHHPPIGIGQTVSFSIGGSAARYLGRGWSGGESWGRWTDGEEAELWLSVPEDLKGDLFMTLKAGGFVAGEHPTTMTEVFVNHCRVARLRFAATEWKEYVIRMPRTCFGGEGEAQIVFHNLSPASPSSLGLSSDPRDLGIGVVSLRLDNELR